MSLSADFFFIKKNSKKDMQNVMKHKNIFTLVKKFKKLFFIQILNFYTLL